MAAEKEIGGNLDCSICCLTLFFGGAILGFPIETFLPKLLLQESQMEKNRLSRLNLWHRRILGISVMLFLLGTPSLFAEKTDIVVLDNGDRITGEIKKLEKGRLAYNTDDMGWLYIDWTKIIKIASRNQFDVETETGLRYIGSIQEASEPGKMIVSTEEGLVTLSIITVVKISPIESLFRDRFKGYVDIGFNLEKANQLKNLILGTEVTYRTIKWEIKFEVSSYLKSEDTSEDISRHKLSLAVSRLMKNRWQATFLSLAQHNSELRLKLRTMLGGGIGRNVIQTNSMLLLLMGGIVGTREQFMESDEVQYNLELMGGISFQAFRLDHPRLDTSLNLLLYPNVTDFGRIRL
ncbi:MAG: DUF481 domain-containing protein, partial [Candidatus Aminicenantes bacterium]